MYRAASSASDNAYKTMGFGGTSGATPTIAAAMMLWRHWSGASSPGLQYAMAIALGDNHSGDAGYNNERGAGIWRTPDTFHVFGNATTVSQGSSVEITFPAVSAGDARVQGAIWWPEGFTQTHNDVDLQLVNPSGVIVATSTSVDGVFEKVSAAAPAAGTWKLRINGYRVSGVQTVHWVALRVTN